MVLNVVHTHKHRIAFCLEDKNNFDSRDRGINVRFQNIHCRRFVGSHFVVYPGLATAMWYLVEIK